MATTTSPRFTLDTNCLIDVEESRPDAPFIREIVGSHGNGITVAVSAIGASERQRNKAYAQNFSEFQAKLKAIGFDGLELLLPLAYMDVCFWDHCVMADESDTLESDIHAVLFPSIEFMWVDYAKTRGLPVDAMDKTWRNAKCDVLGLWCHIKHGGGVFVTSDSNFHAVTKQDRLRALGAGAIAYPKDAAVRATTNGGRMAYKPDSPAAIYKVAQTLRNEERLKLEELLSLVKTALAREADPEIRKTLQASLEDAQRALDADARN